MSNRKDKKMEEKIIKEILLNLEIPISLLGFKYIKTLIIFFLYEDISKITTAYKVVAKKHKATASKVERAIRHALERSKVNEYFKIKHKITNKEFIELIKNETLEKLSVKQENMSKNNEL